MRIKETVQEVKRTVEQSLPFKKWKTGTVALQVKLASVTSSFHTGVSLVL